MVDFCISKLEKQLTKTPLFLQSVFLADIYARKWEIPLLAGFIFGVAASGVLGRLVIWFANGFWNEALSIAITVIVLDRLNRQRAKQTHKQSLIREAGSIANPIAVDAVEQLRQMGLLTGSEGVLQGRNLIGANLEKARLQAANLSGAVLGLANLRGANLVKANLSGADLVRADLPGVRLVRANLSGADLWRANLSGANLVKANLSGANLVNVTFDEKTILPDGTKWTPNTDITRYTKPKYPDFWQPDWVQEQSK